MHAEVPDNLSISHAHDRVSAMEESIIREVPGIQEVLVHIEPSGEKSMCRPAAESLSPEIHEAINQLQRDFPSLLDCHSVSITSDSEGQLVLSFHCSVSPDLDIGEAHELTERIEAVLHQQFSNLVQILIHVEPQEPG